MPARWRGAVLGAIALGAAVSCSRDEPSSPPPSGEALRVLFIGNSLTAANNLPRMVERLAAASGLDIATVTATESGFALEDHWTMGTALDRVREGGFDVVVLQQGPSSLASSRANLREWTQQWAGEVRAIGAIPALYSVWPEAARMHAFGDVSESYRLAAEDVGGLWLPVGDVWLETWERLPSAPLYGPDQFHPSASGTYAAAVVIVSVLAERRATTLSSSTGVVESHLGSLNASVAGTIRSAAQAVLLRAGIVP